MIASAVSNDATCAALAEWRVGAGRGIDDLVVVTLGTGLGGGVVAGGPDDFVSAQDEMLSAPMAAPAVAPPADEPVA